MRIRKIYRNEMNHYIVDACFLADKYIPLNAFPTKNASEKNRQRQARLSRDWWKEIENGLKNKKARVYIPDVCISETFKTLAKKHYIQKWYDYQTYALILKKIRKDLRMDDKELAKKDRKVKYHDLPTTRDIIVSIDRFFQIFFKHGYKTVSVPDLIIVASAKYLMDFYSVPYDSLHIISSDNEIVNGSKKLSEIPNVYDPSKDTNSVEKIFLDRRKKKPS